MNLVSDERKRSRKITALLAVVLLISAFCSLFLGRYSISPGEVLNILFSKLMGTAEKSADLNVVWDIRLSRVLLNILVGAGLSAAGTAFQAIFHNRLVSPDILGVSNGAGFGAALALLLAGGTAVFLTGFAFAFGLLSVFLTFALSKFKQSSSTLAMVLSGVIVSSMFNALISLIKLVADTESELPAITYWLMGSFAGTTFDKVLLAGIPVAAGLVVLFLMRWKLNVLSMGDEEAYALGIDPNTNRIVIITASTIITAACVTVTGIIGWIGMILPNICREFVSADNQQLLPVTCVAGATFMVLVDLLARCVTPGEIPIGILTALVGAPVFALIYRKEEKPG